MFLRNLVMAIILALFYLKYLGTVANVASQLNKEKPEYIIGIYILKTIFLGVSLCIFLTLLGFMSFGFGNCFICTGLICLYQMAG